MIKKKKTMKKRKKSWMKRVNKIKNNFLARRAMKPLPPLTVAAFKEIYLVNC
jgi:hypothetical protein